MPTLLLVRTPASFNFAQASDGSSVELSRMWLQFSAVIVFHHGTYSVSSVNVYGQIGGETYFVYVKDSGNSQKAQTTVTLVFALVLKVYR